MKRFLVVHRKMFMFFAAVLFMAVVTLPLMGCGVPTWLSDAGSIIILVGSSFASIASFIAGLTGNAALAVALGVISTWITKVETGLSDIEALVQQYNESPTPTLLSNIEAALADVQQNIQTDFSNLGLPAEMLTVIAGIAGVALQQLIAWGSLIPAFKAKAMDKFELTVPMTKSEFKTAVNSYLSMKTGDPMIDAALAKAKRT